MIAAVKTHSVGLGMLVVVRECDDVLVARGLGSCIGIAAYERSRRIAALAHVMLPGPPTAAAAADQPARYAQHAIESLIEEIQRYGGRLMGIKLKLAGGAQVINLHTRDDRLQVGLRNIHAVRLAAAQYGLPILGEATGGNVGRTVSLYAATGETTVRVVGGQEQSL